MCGKVLKISLKKAVAKSSAIITTNLAVAGYKLECSMETSHQPWSIVLVPRPLTPFAAFAWYAISELLPEGVFVKAKRYFRWINVTAPRGELYSPHGVVFNLNTNQRHQFEGELLRWL